MEGTKLIKRASFKRVALFKASRLGEPETDRADKNAMVPGRVIAYAPPDLFAGTLIPDYSVFTVGGRSGLATLQIETIVRPADKGPFVTNKIFSGLMLLLDVISLYRTSTADSDFCR